MPGQWWMMSGMTLAASVAMGVALGSYVTSPQTSAAATEEMWTPEDAPSYADAGGASLTSDDDRGPAVIRCTGCGPTLTERRFAADMAGMDADGMISGSSDPVVQDYLAQDHVPTDEALVIDAAPVRPAAEPRPERPKLAAGDALPKPIRASQGVVPPTVLPTIGHDHP